MSIPLNRLIAFGFLQEILQTTSVETLALEVRNVFKSTNSSSVANIILGAAELGHLGVYQLITETCVDKNPPSLFTTPLHKAAGRGHLSVCQFIIKNTVNKNPNICSGPTEGWTPLHFAARSGHVEVCRLIIKHARNNDTETPNGLTPLHYAARYGHFEVCKLIVENVYVYDKNPRSHRVFHGCWTPLGVAKKYGHFEICRLIRSAIRKSGNFFQL